MPGLEGERIVMISGSGLMALLGMATIVVGVGRRVNRTILVEKRISLYLIGVLLDGGMMLKGRNPIQHYVNIICLRDFYQ